MDYKADNSSNLNLTIHCFHFTSTKRDFILVKWTLFNKHMNALEIYEPQIYSQDKFQASGLNQTDNHITLHPYPHLEQPTLLKFNIISYIRCAKVSRDKQEKEPSRHNR